MTAQLEASQEKLKGEAEPWYPGALVAELSIAGEAPAYTGVKLTKGLGGYSCKQTLMGQGEGKGGW